MCAHGLFHCGRESERKEEKEERKKERKRERRKVKRDVIEVASEEDWGGERTCAHLLLVRRHISLN